MRNANGTLVRVIFTAAAWLLFASATAHADAYVSPNGNDNNSGTLAQPYQTIQKCATTVTSGATCFILAGTYRETVTPNSGITISPYQNQLVTIDGSNPVTGWTLYSGGIYRAQVTLSSGDTNQIFVNGQMMTEAQWPTGGSLFQPVWATAQTGTNATTLVDSSLPNINWTGAHVHFWSGSDPWNPQTGRITASSPGSLTFTLDGASFPPYIQPQPGGYYFLFGSLGALTVPGQWYYDSSAGYLYLWAPGGANPNMLTVTAKVRQYGFDLSNVSNVTIEGVNLFATTINSNSSSTNNTINGITATYLSHFTTLPDNPCCSSSYWNAHLGDTGIILDGSGNVLENSTISYSAGNGVTVYGTNETVENNLIHHIDYMGNNDSGVAVQGSGDVVTHNTIYAIGRVGIYLHNIFNNQVSNSDLDISYNNVFQSMLISRDAGEIYTGGPPCVVSSTIRYNWLHDTQSLYAGPADNFPLAGVYIDEDACGWQVYQNIIWNNEYRNIFLHGSTTGATNPNNNAVYNNSIPDNKPNGYIWLQAITNCGTTSVYNNLVYVPIQQTGGSCNAYNNGSSAPGADMMSNIVPGCNFAGCMSNGPPIVPVAHDFNGDGKSDILWRDTAGDVGLWLMNGTQIIQGGVFSSVPLNWMIVGQRDFNGDGTADILWRDTAGDVGLWLMNGTQIIQGGAFSSVPLNWTIVGTGDFNGDGKADILWLDNQGNVGIWFMNGTQILQSATVGRMPANWSVVGSDMKGDIFWRNTTTGQFAMWVMNGTTIAQNVSFGQQPLNWAVVGIGDFDGNGSEDVLWRDTAGDVAIWLMNGTQFMSSATFANVPLNWSIVQTGDYNGAGKTDILWLDTSGNVGVWFMNGTTFLQGYAFGNVGTNWNVQSLGAD